MQSAYHSPEKGLQQHNIQMLDTQINLNPVHTALLRAIWTLLVSLNHKHLNAASLLAFNCLFD